MSVKSTDSKKIAVVVVFTAVSVALVFSPAKIPAPYAPFLVYQIWEIPIVAAFLLYGLSVGVSITTLNTIILLIIYPGALPTGPLYNLAAILSMLCGIYIVRKFAVRFFSRQREIALTVFSTAVGVTARVGVMSIVNWICLQYPYPIGYNLPAEAVIAYLPLIGVFNGTLALYTIPTGYFLARAINTRIRTTKI